MNQKVIQRVYLSCQHVPLPQVYVIKVGSHIQTGRLLLFSLLFLHANHHIRFERGVPRVCLASPHIPPPPPAPAPATGIIEYCPPLFTTTTNTRATMRYQLVVVVAAATAVYAAEPAGYLPPAPPAYAPPAPVYSSVPYYKVCISLHSSNPLKVTRLQITSSSFSSLRSMKATKHMTDSLAERDQHRTTSSYLCERGSKAISARPKADGL